MAPRNEQQFDIFVIGGGINGAGIARDAAGRGYHVAMAEMGDFASGTSSASTKLFHGGLRYLEFFEFRLVRESLIEREILLKAMPHIAWPMRFVLPVYAAMRFDSDTPTARLLKLFLPWMNGRRPRWLIRLGLFLYDHLGGRKILPGTSYLDLKSAAEGAPLADHYQHAYEYSDCWVEDSRLTLLNIRDAQAKGAVILSRTRVTEAVRHDDYWEVAWENQMGKRGKSRAKLLVNATGPWVDNMIKTLTPDHNQNAVRLVRGSHIVTHRLYPHNKCYFFQGTDGRIMFAIPYEEDFTLIGTTDWDHTNMTEKPVCSPEEIDYMINFANQYFKKPIVRKDVIWQYSGVRALYDLGANSPTEATRDYVLALDQVGGAPVLTIFGGKLTTYRKLAEKALVKIDAALAQKTQAWTANAPLPGGDIPLTAIPSYQQELAQKLPFFDGFTIRRLIRQYGTESLEIFADVPHQDSLGKAFGHGVTAREIDWAIAYEWVTSAEDFLFRRSKMGLRFSAEQVKILDQYIQEKRAGLCKAG